MTDEPADVRDERLLAELRLLAGRLDPPPAELLRAARDSYTWRTVDAELAELTYDSDLDDAALAGVRGAGQRRLLTFEAPAVTVEVEVVAVGGRRRLVGQLVPPASAELGIRHGEGSTSVRADDLGRFAASDLPAGPVSVRCRLRGPDQQVVSTDWVAL